VNFYSPHSHRSGQPWPLGRGYALRPHGLLLLAPFLFAQLFAQSGADVFARSCANGYCHGANGQGGGAPKLAGRGFDEAYIISVTRAGVPGTAMQGYGTVLTRPEFNAVVAYVASLNGIVPRAGDAPLPALSGDALRGRELFSDPLRGFARCSTCHHVDGVGIAVAPIARVPSDLRNAAATHVQNVSIGSDRFPALVVSQGGRRVSVYDLSVVPPVLRSADANQVNVSGAANWRHSNFAGSYSDAELAQIAAFLRSQLN